MFEKQIVKLLAIASVQDARGRSHIARRLNYVVAQLANDDKGDDADVGALLESFDESNDIMESDKKPLGEKGGEEGGEDLSLEDAEPTPPATETAAEPKDTQGEMHRSLGLSFSAYVDFAENVLENVGYLGEDKIEVIKLALHNTDDLISRILEDSTPQYYQDMVHKYREELSAAKRKIEDLSKQPLTRTRVVHDRYLLFGPFDRLYKAMRRQFKGDEKFQRLLFQLDSLATVIQQVIEAVPENVSKTDLVRSR